METEPTLMTSGLPEGRFGRPERSGLPEQVLVVGATGMLGRPVTAALVQAGVRVRALVRDPARARTVLAADPGMPGDADVADSVELVTGDVLEPATLAAAITGCQAVHVSLSGGMDPRRIERVEHEGTAAVARAAAAAGVEHLTYLSGGNTSDTPLPDGTDLPMTSIAKSRAEAAIRRSGVPWTSLRATMFMETLPQFVRGRTAVVFTPAPTAFHWIAARDYAQLVVRVLATPATRNHALYILGPQALTLDQALALYRENLAPGLRVRHVPTALLTAAAAASRNPALRETARAMRMFGTGRETAGDPTLTRTLTDTLVGPLTTDLPTWCHDAAVAAADAAAAGPARTSRT